MSYIYSQALVEEFSRANCSGIDAFAQLNGSHTHKLCLSHDKTMDVSRLSRFGMMCKPLTANLGAELLTWWLADSRVKTSALPETAQDLTESVVECGTTWPASLAKLDRATSSWRTAQLSLLGDLEEFSQTWPRWGLMRNGECLERQTLVHRTSESASGLWQTPVADDAANRAAGKWNSRGEPKLSAQVMWPTPLSSNSTGAGHGPNKKGGPNLQTAVAMWPTPTSSLGTNGGSVTPRKGREGGTLIEALSARTWPTATATAYKGWSPSHNRADTDDRLDYSVERESFTAGQQTPPMRLNPAWVEWLMGWPIGHTELKPLGTDRFREWQQQHGNC